MGSTPRVLSQRVGIIGDVHTESAALALALDLLRERLVTQILCVGDIADGPEDVNGMERCRELLTDNDVITVCGNHDRWLLEGTMRDLDDAIERHELEAETLSYLENLPTTLEFESPAGRLLLCHGLGGDDMGLLSLHENEQSLRRNGPLQEILEQHRYRIVIHGHSHKRVINRLDSTLFINAGTLHRDFGPCVGLIDFESQVVEFYDLAMGSKVPLIERMTLGSP